MASNFIVNSMKQLTSNVQQIKFALKYYLHTHSFSSVDEYFNVNREG